VSLAKAQTIMTFQNAEKNGVVFKLQDSLYRNAYDDAKGKGVFNGRTQEFDDAWGKFYLDLMYFFNVNKLTWGKPTYCFNKVYFDKTGKVEQWYFNFKKTDSIPQAKQEVYLKLIKEFSEKQKINISTDRKFSQCASVDLIDVN
jgi:hypothetical protein